MPEVWGIHNGGDPEADGVYLRKNHIAIGWKEVGDLSKLKDREAFRTAFRKAYPGWSHKQAMVGADQVFRFSNLVNVGDVIVYRSRIDGFVHIGTIVGPITYSPDLLERFPRCREVKWDKSLEVTAFTPGFRHELGSALTFFKLKTHAKEALATLTGTDAPLTLAEANPSDEPDENMSIEQIEGWAQDFIVGTLSTQLKGIEFEDFVKHLLERMGYRVDKTPPNSPGVDLIAYRGLGIDGPMVKVSVKSQSSSVDLADINALFAQLASGEIGLLIALSNYTMNAKKFADHKSNLRLIDGIELVRLIYENYDHFDANYRAMLPLKKMYVPIIKEGST
jgi:restriction system protein